MGRIEINRDLLPIKAHYFCFMAALGPILPQLAVYGKDLGISSSLIGTINAILPFLFLLAKPLFGLIVDIYRIYRKAIFIALILTMSISFAFLHVIPGRALKSYNFNSTCAELDTCNVTDLKIDQTCTSVKEMTCKYHTPKEVKEFPFLYSPEDNVTRVVNCVYENTSKACDVDDVNYDFNCMENIESNTACHFRSWQFWCYVLFMALGNIGFNVVNSISDAICFDVVGEDYDYGKQRVWGSIGFGLTALLSGYIINWISDDMTLYTPAFIIMLIFTILDLFSCAKLELPIIPASHTIFKDLGQLLNNRHSIVFILYSVFAGIVDSFFVYYLFWYLEDIAIETNTSNVKLLEGLIVAAETLGGEVIFFSISGLVLERFGHVRSFSMCFITYALRLGLISVVPSPWWILPIEFVLQGPTYALTYTTIVAYANAIAPEGTSATMQGIAAGMDDGFGFAIGSFVGGLLLNHVGGRGTLQVFSAFSLLCSITHTLFYKLCLQHKDEPNQHEYKTPAEAALATYDTSTVSDIHCL